MDRDRLVYETRYHVEKVPTRSLFAPRNYLCYKKLDRILHHIWSTGHYTQNEYKEHRVQRYDDQSGVASSTLLKETEGVCLSKHAMADH